MVLPIGIESVGAMCAAKLCIPSRELQKRTCGEKKFDWVASPCCQIPMAFTNIHKKGILQ